MSKRRNELNQMDKYEYAIHEQELESSSGGNDSSSGGLRQGFERAPPAALQQRRIITAARPNHGSNNGNGNNGDGGGGRNVFANINLAAPRPAASASAAPSFSFGSSSTTTTAAAPSSFSFGGGNTATTATASSSSASGTGGPPAVGSPTDHTVSSAVREQTKQLYAGLRSKVMKELLVHHAGENWTRLLQNVVMAEQMLAQPPPQVQPPTASGSGSNGGAAATASFSFGSSNINALPQQQQPPSSVPAFSFGAPPPAAAASAAPQQSSVPPFSFGAAPAPAAAPAAASGGFTFSNNNSSSVGGGTGSSSSGGFTFGSQPAAALTAANPFAPVVAPGGSSAADADDNAPVEDHNPADAIQPAESDPAWDEVGAFCPVNAYRLVDIKDAKTGFTAFATKGKLYVQKSTASNDTSPPGQCRLLMRDASGIRVLINMLLHPDSCNLKQDLKEKDQKKPASKEYSIISFSGNNTRGQEQIRLKTNVPVGKQLYQTLRETIDGNGGGGDSAS